MIKYSYLTSNRPILLQKHNSFLNIKTLRSISLQHNEYVNIKSNIGCILDEGTAGLVLTQELGIAIAPNFLFGMLNLNMTLYNHSNLTINFDAGATIARIIPVAFSYFSQVEAEEIAKEWFYTKGIEITE